MLEYKSKNPWQWIQTRFNVDKEQAKELWLRSQTSCNICGKSWDGESEKLCIDHCHTTGVIRGILCKNCNHVLGHARDSIQTLERAIEYLKENS